MSIKKQIRTLLRYPLNNRNRDLLSNHDFSIISSNCVGGVISHELGIRFNSPTVNLWIKPSDFVKLAMNTRHYFEGSNLCEEKEVTDEKGYPVATLDDITIFFMHYKSFDEAKAKWEERCKRVNYQNLYYIMCERDGCSINDIMSFNALPSKHKVVFVKEDMPDIKYSYCIPGTREQQQIIDLCLYKNKFTGRRWIDDYDYVSFLNSK